MSSPLKEYLFPTVIEGNLDDTSDEQLDWMRCGTCKYSKMNKFDTLICRRFPEAILKEVNDWCGEWKENPAVSAI